jgi:hypothetical protein
LSETPAERTQREVQEIAEVLSRSRRARSPGYDVSVAWTRCAPSGTVDRSSRGKHLYVAPYPSVSESPKVTMGWAVSPDGIVFPWHVETNTGNPFPDCGKT